VSRRALVLWLRALRARDRLGLAWLRRLHPGLEVHPSASTNLAVARFNLAPDATLRIGPRVAADRIPGALHFYAEPGAHIEVQEGTWLRSEVGALHLVAFAGGRMVIGPDCLLNGCHLSAKTSLTLGRQASVGPGSRIFDADQHPLDADHPEQSAPVRVGDCAWVAADVTVLRGVSIGAHSVIGARSLVTQDIPDHTLAFGSPARPHGKVGDRGPVAP
jgi:acetyltransferase-like isoleucine patch superfamily enzyme